MAFGRIRVYERIFGSGVGRFGMDGLVWSYFKEALSLNIDVWVLDMYQYIHVGEEDWKCLNV